MRSWAAVAGLAALLLTAIPVPAQETPRAGGVLKAAMIGEPPTLDAHLTTATITYNVMWHVYETVYALDRNYEPAPMLAEGHTVSDDGRRYTIALRRGVKFHNGKELTAADVVASLTRWGRLQTSGKAIWKNVEGLEARDPYTVVFHLKGPTGSLLYGLASPLAAIYPKDVVDAAGDGTLKSHVGTGPFRFVEHKPDRHIRLARFKEYVARAEPPNGYGGKRTAWVDEILFLPTPDLSVRTAGLETGEYHFADQMKQDQYERLSRMPALELSIIKFGFWPTAVLNHRQGLMTNKRLRQAMQATLDSEPILAAAIGNKDFYRVDGSVFQKELFWYSTVGVEAYNQKNKDKARRLLKEAGYTGQPVRWLTTQEYDYMYKSALVARQQLEEVGFKIDLQVLDWATLVQRRGKPELFDVFSTGYPVSFDPALFIPLQCEWPGWWCHEEKERLMVELARETDARKRKAIVDRIQAIFYEDVGRIKFGDVFLFRAARKELRGDFRTQPALHFWNAWLAK
ncbi:MAG TPA: ABC transporter substrate-binding protein [Methylomirabilota bacterium]